MKTKKVPICPAPPYIAPLKDISVAIGIKIIHLNEIN